MPGDKASLSFPRTAENPPSSRVKLQHPGDLMKRMGLPFLLLCMGG